MECDMSDLSDPYRCKLCVKVPKGKRKLMKKILNPVTKWIDPSFQVISISEEDHTSTNRDVYDKNDETCEVECIRAPAISVILFLAENGVTAAKDVQGCLLKPPWKYHHKVELVSIRSPERAAACQQFFCLADNLPLWSVCPIHFGNEHLRILIHVKNFQNMVEFYRVITESEMESSKPGFCIFQLYSQPGLDIQLSLKYSKYIEPYPISTTSLMFKVKSIECIRTYAGSKLDSLRDGTFSLFDPDGNKVYIYQQDSDGRVLTKSAKHHKKSANEDLKSCRSSDSHDSGRCSGSEVWWSEAEPSRNETNEFQGKYSVKGPEVLKSESKTNKKSTNRLSSVIQKCKIKPVYL